MPQRVLITPEAAEIVEKLKDQHGPLIFHQSGGCCDGSQPMCFAADDFKIGNIDICMGEVAGCKFYMAADQFEYWKHTQLTLDITRGRGSSFSLEIPLGLRFMIRSRVFTEEELETLSKQEPHT